MSSVVSAMKIAVSKASVFTETVRKEIDIIDKSVKNDDSPVTLADIGAQMIITYTLQEILGNLFFIAEEDLSFFQDKSDNEIKKRLKYFFEKTNMTNIFDEFSLGNVALKYPSAQDPFFAVDPVDGTKGFIRGNQYSIAAAYVSDRGEVVTSVLAAPLFKIKSEKTGILFSARKYEYSLWQHLGEEKLHVTSSLEWDKKYVVSYEKSHSDESRDLKIAEALGLSPEPQRFDSQLKYALVALGFASLYIRTPRETIPEEKIWDHAAGALILEAAGGKVFDSKGNKHIYTPSPVLAGIRGVCAFAGLDENKVLNSLKI